MRWLGISLVWGLLLFTFMVLIGWVIFGPAPARPGPFYGLIVVVGLLTLVLSVVRQRFKGE
jgi:hypothetical protein